MARSTPVRATATPAESLQNPVTPSGQIHIRRYVRRLRDEAERSSKAGPRGPYLNGNLEVVIRDTEKVFVPIGANDPVDFARYAEERPDHVSLIPGVGLTLLIPRSSMAVTYGTFASDDEWSTGPAQSVATIFVSNDSIQLTVKSNGRARIVFTRTAASHQRTSRPVQRL